MKPKPQLHLAIVLGLLSLGLVSTHAQTSAFTYQGRLDSSGEPANGFFDITFTVWDAASGGTSVAGPLTNSPAAVTNGLFTVTLDFGAAAFPGADRWLEIAVRTNGGGEFAILSPRQLITRTPYAQRATSAGAADTAATAIASATAINAQTVAAGGVGTAALQPGAVNTAALADGAVTSAKIGGELSPSQIPELDAAKITSGTLASARIPSLDASQTASGMFDVARIPALDASKIVAGVLDDARLSGNVALLNADNTFSGSNHLAGVVVATNTSNVVSGSFSGSLTGDVTGNLTGNASTATTAGDFTSPLIGDVTGTQGATVVSTVGGETAANVAIGANAANAATTANTANMLVKRDATGNFSAGTITASLVGNASSATVAVSFSGPLAGDVTGTQGTTIVSSVGGETAASVAGGVSAANAATSANTPNTIVKRDGSGGLSAGTVSAGSFAGDGSGLTSLDGAKISAGTVGTTQLASGAAAANLMAGGQSAVPSGGMILSTNPADANLQAAGYLKLGNVFLNDGWERRSTYAAPSPRQNHCAVWTGSEMIIWGGYQNGTNLADGGRYNPSIDAWTPISTNGAPSPRYGAFCHWTGSKMLVWGGSVTAGATLNDGALYDPILDAWTPMSTVGAPAPRGVAGETPSAWTGTEFIVWGGYDGTNVLGSGARYQLQSDSWTTITSSGAPTPRRNMIYAWSGTELLIYGGFSSGIQSTGFRYNPALDTWSTMSATGSPGSRRSSGPIAVWTGSEMVFWGGMNASNGSEVNSGFRYNPTANSWTTMSAQNAPVSRVYGYAFLADGEYFYWGGRRSNPPDLYGDGGIYNAEFDEWTSMSSKQSPSPRFLHTLVWTGMQMLLFGGSSTGDATSQFGDLWAYTPPQEFYLYQRP